MDIVKSGVGSIAEPKEVATPSADSDALLVERVKTGDMAAFDTLTTKYRDRIFSVVYNMSPTAKTLSTSLRTCLLKPSRA